MKMTRRGFLGSAAGFAAVGGGLPCRGGTGSVYRGVPIGVITYSYRSMPVGKGKSLEYVLASGIGTVELMSNDVEIDAGAPMNKLPWKMSKDERDAFVAWRLTADINRYAEVRARYDAAGVTVHIVRFEDIGARWLSDAEMDYRFKVARAMGANAITREIPDSKDLPGWWEAEGRRLAAFAEKWGVNIAFHNHLQINATTYDGPLLGYSKRFMINYDIGHFTATNDTDPLDIVRKYHDRIASIHIKDRTSKAHGQKHVPFGKGDTPLAGLFALMVKEGWNFPCDIELEYAIPKDSDPVREVNASREYCKGKIG
jgi:sugar phosphate isomerase/epimerase